MLVTEKLNIGAQAKKDYAYDRAVSSSGKPAAGTKADEKEAELILSESAKQAAESQKADIQGMGNDYTPEEAMAMVSAANAKILDQASDSILAQANQDANKVAELLSA